MKVPKIRVRLLIVSMVIFVMLLTPFAAAQANEATIVANQGILRRTANFDGDIVETLSLGTQITLQERNGDWYRVQSPNTGTEGWMYKDLIVTNGEGSSSLKKGIITASTLNVRSIPSLEGSVITRLSSGSEVTILSQEEEWYQVQLSQGPKGFIHSDFVVVVPNLPQAQVLENSSRLRKEANLQANIIVTLNKTDTVFIKGYEGGWYNVVTRDFTEGWISSESIELQIDIARPVSRSGTRSHALSNIKSVSEKYLGTPYRYATAGPSSFDCSGFVFYILNTYYKDYLNQRGINLPRSSRDQANVGTSVSRNQLQIGDLVFFNNGTSSTINHVGIYIGNNQFIHSSSGRSMGVIISSLDEANYKRRYSTATRL
ncbi:NLP/P60 protein [Clostridium aceticum]|uniref:NLP/P60 protein n=1 Tax=Clostridium aceticum TaxID=84022 RepID=A0A0G3W9P6_9CLOT|nr:SH3 domain-containing protein [Clostridium aceticum]AKL95073.1 NLP/P60 protein [Clostridium aceticum]